MAPSLVARTAMSTVAWPDIITTGEVTPAARISSSNVTPSLSGITTSEKIRSNVFDARKLQSPRRTVRHRHFVPLHAKSTRQRGQRVRIIVND